MNHCRDCRFYRPDSIGTTWGECRLAASIDGGQRVHAQSRAVACATAGAGALDVHPDFGCVQWKLRADLRAAPGDAAA